jgi:cell division protein FtsL
LIRSGTDGFIVLPKARMLLKRLRSFSWTKVWMVLLVVAMLTLFTSMLSKKIATLTLADNG